jgi:NAD(P)-dependent dehydrogenase (short-subunit alcohol dehydrogenase family)
MQAMTLSGKVAIVTGGARGVGKGVAAAFVKAGASVLIVDRDAELGRSTEAELSIGGGQAVFLPFDLSRHRELQDIVDAAIGRFGRLDTLVNVAQAAQLLPIAELTDERCGCRSIPASGRPYS